MTPITIGADAPDFKAKDNKKQDIKLSDFKGKKSTSFLASSSLDTSMYRSNASIRN